MSNSAMTTFAAEVPTTMEDLTALGILGENIEKVYGERLVKNINAYVQQEKLEKYMEGRVAKRRKLDVPTASVLERNATPATSSSAYNNGGNKNASKTQNFESFGFNEDEFDVDIDFSSIDIPNNVNASGSKTTGTAKSSYF
jgi:hypothetical protein